MKTNANIMDVLIAVVKMAITTYSLSPSFLFGLKTTTVPNEETVVSIKNDIHNYFSMAEETMLLRCVKISELYDIVKLKYGILGVSYMEASIVVDSTTLCVSEFTFPTWDVIAKRFIRNVTKMGRRDMNYFGRFIFEGVAKDPLTFTATKIRFEGSDTVITFDGTVMATCMYDLNMHVSIRENLWMGLYQEYQPI